MKVNWKSVTYLKESSFVNCISYKTYIVYLDVGDNLKLYHCICLTKYERKVTSLCTVMSVTLIVCAAVCTKFTKRPVRKSLSDRMQLKNMCTARRSAVTGSFISLSRSIEFLACVLVCYIAISRVVMKFRTSRTWHTQEMKCAALRWAREQIHQLDCQQE